MEPIWTLVVVPVALGLLGFIEPCSIGASLLFLKSVEGNSPAVKVMQASVFTLTRALFIAFFPLSVRSDHSTVYLTKPFELVDQNGRTVEVLRSGLQV